MAWRKAPYSPHLLATPLGASPLTFSTIAVATPARESQRVPRGYSTCIFVTSQKRKTEYILYFTQVDWGLWRERFLVWRRPVCRAQLHLRESAWVACQPPANPPEFGNLVHSARMVLKTSLADDESREKRAAKPAVHRIRNVADPSPRMKKPRMRANSRFACGALNCVSYSEATYLPVT